jgi:hypothetical protein
MQIKTFRPDFEIWKLNDEETAEILQRLRADLGDDWRSAPPDVINETLREYLYQEWRPCEEVTGEGFLPIEISGKDGFFETPPIDPADLFKTPEEIPANIHAILNTWDENGDPYKQCKEIDNALKPLGYTFDWGLSGEPYNLRRII